ncbi:hypothetical protein J5N97_014951 [Dioscorea zingiberensis]|uniref:BHLH domain-containing protein n=1 Tax=Dioscorea zingiberensis TaxID=325984 RepID=A0A9D5CUW3_9LILI|nr:hypothetical protein J5N97_014951 [Dioscorea zingiberensis]
MLGFFEPEVELCRSVSGMQQRDALFPSFSSPPLLITAPANKEQSSINGHANDMETLRKQGSKRLKISQPAGEPSTTIHKLRMNAPVKKSQKLGDKITALQQLVSPFGKTDTASVLLEATICIKALHEQIQVLASPYFCSKLKTSSQVNERERAGLHGRGLCLVPISPGIIKLANQEHNQHGVPERFARRSLGRGSPKN